MSGFLRPRESATAGPGIRVLIADDQQRFRNHLRASLDLYPGMVVVGEAATGPAAISLARDLRPDVVLMDVQLPHLDGIEATRAIRSARPDAGVVMLTAHQDDGTVLAALRAGARGYLVKGADSEEIGHAVAEACNGGVVLGAQVAMRVIGFIALPPEEKVPFPALTPRERAILELLADGRSNLEIVRDLGLSQKTVRNYLSHIFAKLRVSGRAEAATLARRSGFGPARAGPEKAAPAGSAAFSGRYRNGGRWDGKRAAGAGQGRTS